MFLTAMPLTLAPVPVPNLIPPGTPFDGVMFDAAAIVVTGEIDAPGVVDYFVFDAVAGDKFTIELISDTLDFRLELPLTITARQHSTTMGSRGRIRRLSTSLRQLTVCCS